MWYDSVRYGPRKSDRKEIFGLDCSVSGLTHDCGCVLVPRQAPLAKDFPGGAVADIDLEMMCVVGGLPGFVPAVVFDKPGVTLNVAGDALADVAGVNLVAVVAQVTTRRVVLRP